MYKIVFIFLLLTTSLVASTSIKTLAYESGISIYGQIGTVTLILEENHDAKTYKMVAKTKSIGMVKFLSGNRRDTFISEGIISDGVYLPQKFVRYTLKNDSNKTRTYIFDYHKKSVHKREVITKLLSDSSFDPVTLDFIEEERTVEQIKEEEIDFEVNDFLSLYLNLTKGNLTQGEVPYIDMKEKDKLLYLKKNLFEVHKHHGEDKYSVVMIPDKNSIFFQEVHSINISFYGDAYIKKTSENTKVLSN